MLDNVLWLPFWPGWSYTHMPFKVLLPSWSQRVIPSFLLKQYMSSGVNYAGLTVYKTRKLRLGYSLWSSCEMSVNWHYYSHFWHYYSHLQMYSQMQNFILTYAKNLREPWCLDHFQNINICSKLFSTRFELGSQNNVTYLLSLKFLWPVQLLSNFNCIREALYLERRLNIQASLHDFNERTNGNSYLSYAKRDTNKWSRVLLPLALT